MPVPTLYTPRLLLRPLQVEDAAAIQRIFPQWEIVRYMAANIPWPYPADGARQFLQEIALPAMAKGSESYWSLRLRTDPAALIGVISLHDQPDNNRGFWLSPVFWRRGLMGEACAAVNSFWFEDLQRSLLRVPKAALNEGSRRLSLLEGMSLVAQYEADYVCGRLPTELWELSREAWLSTRRGQA
ncbi:GNAT family N-acetyltransferase [Pseudomonas oryzihabitans]|uniref:GNAT family N-acetyltransferase n=1 Tax=Pseudomonas oryzihabitans TaxID=47885 RepID=UPI0028651EFA|nr:GNAT family N-acetyltransferase [Pseudomonas psychrotolerans]MDR6677838.1 RimJ/RimL family protein N-acetyltransferase [Pseudomonas psychrotolerans]